MTFVDRFIFVIGLSVAVTLGVIVGAAFVAGERVSGEIEQARVSHLIGALRSATEANLAIGLTLDEISQIQSTIEREKANDPAIIAIDVYNSAGRSIYSTDRGILGEAVEQDWVDNLDRDDVWRASLRGETVFGTRFENDFDVAGGIAVTISGMTRRMRVEALGLDLASRTLAVAAGALLLSLVCAFAAARAIDRPFLRVAAILRGEPQAQKPGRLDRLALQVRETWSTTDARLARGTEQLKAIDDVE